MSYYDSPRDERITLRLPTELRDRVEALARRERRTLSDYIFILLADQASRADTVAEEPAEYNAPPRPVIQPAPQRRRHAP